MWLCEDVMLGATAAFCEHEETHLGTKATVLRMGEWTDEKNLGP